MKILIDAHMVGERETGNETYIVNLIRGLQNIGVSDEIVLAAAHADALSEKVGRQYRMIPVSVSPWRRLGVDFPAIVRREKVDVLHVTYAGPLRAECPIVVTIHDVAYRTHPEWFSLRDRIVLSCGIAWTIRRARKVIAVSEYTRHEMKEVFPFAEPKIEVTLEAADSRFVKLDACQKNEGILKQKGIRLPFILAVGNLQPRKNLSRMIRALAKTKKRAGLPHQLVIAGKALWRESEIYRSVRENGLENHVVFTGYVPDEDLVQLYNQADVFVYPSLYEGFGLPVIEAMACGTPVVTSDSSSIPEVAGDAAMLVNPEDVESIAQGLETVVTNTSLKEALGRKGVEQARKFTWEKTAEQTLRIYREAGMEHGE